ncbi:hypothetical protein HYW32_02280 [Candidatus Berkelbacteria bacterium]|nr:hypothetical protein [Candidatus Berkelbacteria bacterium]
MLLFLQNRPGFARILFIGVVSVAVVLGLLLITGHAKAAVLIQKGDTLMNQGQYQAAKVAYEEAERYWSFQKAELRPKIEQVKTLIAQDVAFAEGDAQRATGEWQACVNAFSQVTEAHANYNAASAAVTEFTSNLTPVPAANTKSASNTPAKKMTTKTTTVPAASESAPTPVPETPSSTESSNNSTPEQTVSEASEPVEEQQQSSTPSCTSNTNPSFTHHITDLGLVAKVVSPPTKAGTDLKPHGYVDTQLTSAPVYAPIAATLESGAFYQEGNPDGEYLLVFKASCEVTFRFDHITNPIQVVKDAFPTKQSHTRTNAPASAVSFMAGEQIGTTTGTIDGIWDFGVYNSSTSNRYADDPIYNWSSNATTAVCPWSYYSTSMYAQYSALFGSLGGNPPDGEPFCS